MKDTIKTIRKWQDWFKLSPKERMKSRIDSRIFITKFWRESTEQHKFEYNAVLETRLSQLPPEAFEEAIKFIDEELEECSTPEEREEIEKEIKEMKRMELN